MTTDALASAHAVRTELAPAIDGVIEPLWEAGALFDQFVQIKPDIVRAAPNKTEVYFLYDADAVYLAARVHQPRSTVHSTRGRRDADVVFEGDTIAFLLDPLGGGNSAYVFTVNPANAIADARLIDGGSPDTSWDGIFTSATKIEDDYWTVELRLPISSISFQNANKQTWGILSERVFAHEQRTFLNQVVDENRPYQIKDFHQISGLRDIDNGRSWSVVPYLFGNWKKSREDGSSRWESKAGVDLKLRPTPSMTVLLTAHPDYAQIESDREIINVSDVPTSYPEKRPFFTESGDLYPGLAVNTRNIQDIQVGVKLRQALPKVKYDATFIRQDDSTKWFLGDLRWSDNEKFLVEVIGGLKDGEDGSDYNVTTNLRYWWFDRRLTAYTWFGTINGPGGGSNEWESVNSVRWQTRKVNLGLWNHFKSELYNPNIVGHNTLSNEIILTGWAEHSLFNETARLRQLTSRLEVTQKDLYRGAAGAYVEADLSLRSRMRFSELLGDMEINVVYSPPIEQKFRYRNVAAYAPDRVFRDAFGDFVLERQRHSSYAVTLRSDFSKPFGVAITGAKEAVRGSRSNSTSFEAYWKIGSRALLSYTFDSLKLKGSKFQEPFREAIQRLKLEYNPTDRLNVRAIVDLNDTHRPDSELTEISTPTTNLTVSWEYWPGSFLYFVYNDWRHRFDPRSPGLPGARPGERSLTLKIGRNFTF